MVAGLTGTISPAIETPPCLHAALDVERVIFRKLRARGAGVVGQDAKPRADRKAPRHVAIDPAVAARHDAVLLVCPRHREAINQIAVRIANRAVAVVYL